MESQGSTWQKWDLHIHTPVSFHWSEGKKWADQTPAERDATCQAIVNRLNATEVVAFCVMDYWTFDGYLALRDYLARHPNATMTRIFPGIELRVAAPTDFRLNTHVLVNDEVATEVLLDFVSNLRFSGHDGKPPSRPNFIEIGRSYDPGKLNKHGLKPDDRSDEEKMYRLGMMTADVSVESIENAIGVVGKENCLVIQPYGTSDGIERLNWRDHPFTDSHLMKWAHCFETRKQSEVDLFLGVVTPANERFIGDFLENIGGAPKPVFSGSDAHRIGDYGVYPGGRATWLKAQPTFKGLRQVCHEPTLRCYMGERPPKLEHVDQNPTKYIKTLSMAKVPESTLAEHWFDGARIEFNPGLIAIIGNKGSGKSALADIIALAANSHCSKMEFLNDNRFRSTGNKSKNFSAALSWGDNTQVTVTLDQNSDNRQPERVRYLPQHYIEDLCNEIATGNETNFGRELKKVIFSHVPPEKQLKMGTLDELLGYLVDARKMSIQQHQQSLRTLNETIARNEEEMSENTLLSYTTARDLKQNELDAHDRTKPVEVIKPAESADDATTRETVRAMQAKEEELARVRERLTAAKEERAEFVAHRSSLIRLIGHVDNFENAYKKFIEDHTGEFEDAGLTISEIVLVTINRAPLTNALTKVDNSLNGVALEIAGKPQDDTPAVKGLEVMEKELVAEAAKLQSGLDAPDKAYHAYLTQLATWTTKRAAIVGAADKPETLEYLKDRIKRAKEVIPQALNELREQRRVIVRDIHAEILAIRNAYVELYAPVQGIAAAAATTTAESLQLEFDAYLSTSGFEDNFLDFIRKNRKGSFQGEEESKRAVRDLIRNYEWNTADGVVGFTDAIFKALTNYDRDGESVPVTIESQLRQSKKVTDLYDFLYGLSYVEIRYTMRLGGKDISQLSPGEKGALLLVFYLLLDPEQIPIIIDQPEHNLDNESVVRLLVDCIRRARSRRQVMIVTHNPNLAVFCDADQIIYCTIDKMDGNRIGYTTGAIEDYDINRVAVNVLEGTYPAFDNRRKKYYKPRPHSTPAAAGQVTPPPDMDEEDSVPAPA